MNQNRNTEKRFYSLIISILKITYNDIEVATNVPYCRYTAYYTAVQKWVYQTEDYLLISSGRKLTVMVRIYLGQSKVAFNK